MLKFVAFAALAILFLFAGCTPRRERVRYRMTVVVDTPAGPRTGSAVRESTYIKPSYIPFPLGEDRGSVKVRGEAVSVDLPNGRTLFALLTGVHGDYDFGARIPDRFLGHGKSRTALDRATVWPIDQPLEGLPRLVTFVDPIDYKSVESLSPNSLSRQFGAGYRLQTIYVERTTDPVVFKLAGELPAFDENPQYKRYLRSLPPGSDKAIAPYDLRRSMPH